MPKYKFQVTFHGWVDIEVEASSEEEAYDRAHAVSFMDEEWELEHIDYDLVEAPPPLVQLAAQAEGADDA